jgi:chemotaxis protein MotB
MARKKKHGGHENHERWLVSYADFITLLFAFFVVMFASSQTDKGKAQQVSESVKQALEQGHFQSLVAAVLGGTTGDRGQGNAQMKGPGGASRAFHQGKAPGTGPQEGGSLSDLKPALDVLVQELAEELHAGKMAVSLEPRGLVVSLREAAFFPSGEATISQTNIESIDKLAKVILKLSNPIRMEGHTDSVPIHNERFRSNWELSAARAIAMLELFAGRYKIPRARMSIAAYAENAPADTNDTEEGRARNRRVDIVLLSDVGARAEPHSAGPGALEPPAATKPS